LKSAGLIVDPTPLAAGLAHGLVWMQYRVENVQMTIHIRRRGFIVTLGCIAAGWSVAARAQCSEPTNDEPQSQSNRWSASMSHSVG
jgi:hypothetical protein